MNHEPSKEISFGSNRNVLFIYNPKAGKAKIKKHLFEIIDVFARAEYTLTASPTRFPGDASSIVTQCNADFYDIIICSGGDGTLNEVVTGMIQNNKILPIGYIPAGSTNDFAKSLGISDNMVTAAQNIVKGSIFPCDVGLFNDKAFVYIAAFGLFTEISYATDQHLKNTLGHMAYMLNGLKSLSSVKSYRIKIESEECTFEDEFIYGMITNSFSVGGFKNLTGKDIKLDDGKFEVTLIKRPSCLSELNQLTSSLLSKKMDSPCILHFKTSAISIKSDKKICWTLDGEYGGEEQDVRIENKQKILSIIL